ncbi:MAG: hypothetical protein QXT72_02225 [Candidatus Micrarchaeia archaeon]
MAMDAISRKMFTFRRNIDRFLSNILSNKFSSIENSKKSQRSEKQHSKKDLKDLNKRESKYNIFLKIPSVSIENLLNISIIFSIIGMLSLFALSMFISPKIVSISGISSIHDGAYVKVAGFVFDINSNSFKLCDSQVKKNSECINIIVSQGTVPIFLTEGDYIYAVGSVKKFNNRSYLYVQSKDIALIR